MFFSNTKLISKEKNFQKMPSPHLEFVQTKFKNNTYFDNSNYTGEVLFRESTFEKGDISFDKTFFEEKVFFMSSIFKGKVSFVNTSFKSLVHFYNVNFYKAQQFHLTDFLDRAIFSNTVFHEEAQFLYNKVENNSYINFESTKFKRGLDISRSYFNCNLNFFNVKVEEEGDEYIFKHLEEVKYQVHSREHTEEAVPSVYQQLRETYRIIKNNFYSQNNRIEGLKFYKREMLVYEKEIKSFSLDKALLLANKFSNNYGTDWGKGLLFTMLSGFITYSIILLIEGKVNNITSVLLICTLFFIIMNKTESINEMLSKVFFVFFCCLYVTILCFCSAPFTINWELFIEQYLKTVNVIDLKPFEKEENGIFNFSGLSYLFLFIGRIFIGYGYYQTIQAFRKYGKS